MTYERYLFTCSTGGTQHSLHHKKIIIKQPLVDFFPFVLVVKTQVVHFKKWKYIVVHILGDVCMLFVFMCFWVLRFAPTFLKQVREISLPSMLGQAPVTYCITSKRYNWAK